jgi:chemotaxis protein CheC
MSAKILVIDDSGLARRNLRRILEGAGHDVVEAQDGMAALEMYFSEKPEVVLLDLVMSGMYGLDVLKKLRQLDPAARVIVVSADIQTPSRGHGARVRRRRVPQQARGRGRRPRRRQHPPEWGAPMELTALQRDALTELINIGFGRAAASLSRLTGYRVLLDVPSVSIHPMERLQEALAGMMTGEIATVHQVFTGPVAGDAFLALDESAAALLKELLTSEPALPLRIDASTQEVVTEIGNVLLNACLGTFGNLLKVHVSFSVPRLTVDTLGQVLESVTIDRHELRYALVVHAGLRLRSDTVRSYLIIVLSVASLDRFVQAIDTWQEREGATG